jgi:hypothetical protein
LGVKKGERRGKGVVLRGRKRGRSSMQASETKDQTEAKTRKLTWDGDEKVVVVLYQFATVELVAVSA